MEASERRRVGRRLFFAFALLYLLTMHGRPYSDDVFQFEQIGVLVSTGELVMSPARDPEALGGAGAFMRPGRDGRIYLTLAPGLALASSPLGWLGAKLGAPNPEPEFSTPYLPAASVVFWASATVPIAMAAAMWAAFVLVARRSASIRRGIEAALVMGLGTSLWFYATTFWTQPLATACCLGALVALGQRPKNAAGSALLAGVLLGFAVVTRFELVLITGWFLLLIAASYTGRDRWRACVALIVPLVLVGVALAGWNQFRFGHWLETRSLHQAPGSFHPKFMLDAVPGMLLGPTQGLLIYSPAVSLGLLAIPAAWRSERALTSCVLGIVATLLAFYACFVFWSTPPPMSWGARFLAPTIPFVVLLAFVPADRQPLAPRWARLLVAVSVSIAAVGIIQRVRLGPPTWWADDPARAGWAAALCVALIWLIVQLWRDYANNS